MSRQPHRALAFLRYAVWFALAACLLFPSYAQAQRKGKKKQTPTYGRIQLSTTPGGLPLQIDGQPAGETAAASRNVDLSPGPHTVEVLFPNSKRWTKEFQIVTRHITCVGLAYKTSTASIPPPGNANSSTQGNVEVIEEGEVTETVADCGELGIPTIPPRRRATSKVRSPQ
jgi:hypothetical protein